MLWKSAQQGVYAQIEALYMAPPPQTLTAAQTERALLLRL